MQSIFSSLARLYDFSPRLRLTRSRAAELKMLCIMSSDLCDVQHPSADRHRGPSGRTSH